ncbi:hypothetical protein GXP67_04750 [Rhodocytophaga rosea]|uniref:Uncharacterized protein n=1 Tax=Rhodocytophaga rosea TaxID=2704465 RepID=A0A6C0GED0_9BACT|nr:hypothetical protein [Rhodocytophaga rosea]QHT66030.1 hypothetical protein GXP67_04750 [Rhodocytophaga rosea]
MFEVQFAYQTLFTLKVTHTYYAQQTSPDFKIKPTAASLKLAEKMGVILKADESGIIVIGDVSRPETLLYYLEQMEGLKFTFWLHCSQPYFISITRLPTENLHTLLYFSNSTAHKKGTEESLLHQASFVSAADRYPVKSGEYEIPAQSKETNLELQDDRGRTLKTGIALANLPFRFDLNGLPEGKYKVIVGKKELETFVHTGIRPDLKAIGLVEIFLTGALKDELIQIIKERDTPGTRAYKIAFQARSTYWKYLIVPKYSNGLQHASIATNDKNIAFKGPEKITLANGDSAFMFQSEEVLPLSESAPYLFQLKKNKNADENNGRIIINRLPHPSLGLVKPQSRSDDSKVFSEILVYI